jgi:hypothetical protein
LLLTGANLDTSVAVAPRATGTTDAAVAAWHVWRAAHRRTLALCRKQQDLECELARTIGFPRVILNAAEVSSPVRIGSLQQFDELAAELPSIFARRAEVAAALCEQQRRWADADRAIGFSDTRQNEAAAIDEEERLMEGLLAAEATSLRGIGVKLDVLLAVGVEGVEGGQFPWPELRRIRRDIARLAKLHVRSQAP